MKIVVDARMINASGIGVYLKNILEGVPDTFQVTLLGNPDLLSEFKSYTIIPFYEPIYSIKEQWVLKQTIPECDIFWSPHYNVPLLSIKAKRRVVTIHDVYHLAFSKHLSLVQRLYAKVVINAAVRFSQQVITVSDFSKNEIVKHTKCKADKIKVIYNGVKGQIKVQATTPKLKERYKLPEKYLLFVGNVKPHKNLKTFLQAYLLLDENLKASYSIVVVGKKDGFITGDPELFNWIDATPGLSNRLVFTGYVADKDMDAIYQNASLFVFPSLYEGFGLPPLEAMANGCPAVVSNTSCLPEVCGDAVLYIDPYNVNDIANKIKTGLIDNALRVKLIEQGHQHIKSFAWSGAVSQHIALFKAVLK